MVEGEMGVGLSLLGFPLAISSCSSPCENPWGLKKSSLNISVQTSPTPSKVQALSIEPKVLPVLPVSLPGLTMAALIKYQASIHSLQGLAQQSLT